MDTTYVQTGGVKALTKAHKDAVKDRFKACIETHGILMVQPYLTKINLELQRGI
jgi:hypothetical protein